MYLFKYLSFFEQCHYAAARFLTAVITRVIICSRAMPTTSTTTHRRRSLSESILMLTRSPESVSGDRQILAERRELPVDEPAAASAFRASTSSSRSERHTFQLENTTVQTSTATINTTTTRKARRVLLRAQNVVHEQDARIPFDGTTDDSPNMVTYQHFSCYVQLVTPRRAISCYTLVITSETRYAKLIILNVRPKDDKVPSLI